jgi:hypothetical protein
VFQRTLCRAKTTDLTVATATFGLSPKGATDRVRRKTFELELNEDVHKPYSDKKRDERELAKHVARMGKIRNLNARESPFWRHAYKGRYY